MWQQRWSFRVLLTYFIVRLARIFAVSKVIVIGELYITALMTDNKSLRFRCLTQALQRHYDTVSLYMYMKRNARSMHMYYSIPSLRSYKTPVTRQAPRLSTAHIREDAVTRVEL
jgi:hypothetical protein